MCTPVDKPLIDASIGTSVKPIVRRATHVRTRSSTNVIVSTMKCLVVLLFVSIIGLVSSDNARSYDWLKQYDDNWYEDDLEKLGIAVKKEKPIDSAGEIPEGDAGDSVETGDWNEELSLGDIDSDIEEELKALDSVNDSVDYQYEDIRDDEEKAKEEIDNAIDNDINNKDLDAVVPVQEPEIEKKEISETANLNQENIEENLESIPLPPVADIVSNDFEDLEAEASDPIETRVDIDKSFEKETKKILEDISDTFEEKDEKTNDFDNDNKNDDDGNIQSQKHSILKSIEDFEDEDINIEDLDQIIPESVDNAPEQIEEQFESQEKIEPHILEETNNLLNEMNNNFEEDNLKDTQISEENQSAKIISSEDKQSLKPQETSIQDNVESEEKLTGIDQSLMEIKKSGEEPKDNFDNNSAQSQDTLSEPIDDKIYEDLELKDPTNDYYDNVLEDGKLDAINENAAIAANLKLEESIKENVDADNEDPDLAKLFETMHKLGQDEQVNSDEKDQDKNYIKDYEDKYQRPFREGLVLSQRDYFEYYDDIQENENVSKVDDKSEKENTNLELQSEEKKYKSEEVIDSKQIGDYEELADDDISRLFEENPNSQPVKQEVNLEDDIIEGNINDTEVDAEVLNILPGKVEEKIDIVVKDTPQIDISVPTTEQSNVNLTDTNIESTENKESEVIPESELIPSKSIENLSDDEYKQLMQQFIVEKNDAAPLDCEGNPGPIMIKLAINETAEITSCNYPNPYPTSRLTEWIIEGEGKGYQFVIEDFFVNGVIGDYLLVTAEGTSEATSGSLLFSYQLQEPRKYGFLDVKRLKLRFETHLAFPFRRGFKISVKKLDEIKPPEREIDEVDTETLRAPPATLTVNLGETSLERFLGIEEEFRRLIADMATMYINANQLDPGLNSTLDTTQITRRTVCNIQWPNHRNCTEVSFGVVLLYEDDDEAGFTGDQLGDMWDTYSQIDPFASRLQNLGITEFQVPNDSSVLLVWLVIGAGVIISMVMLSFALWRFSCFEDYTRMGVYSDTESFTNEKRDLDLYPTPHQPLPPLYNEDYKWPTMDSTRVDMGGFANKSYMQDDLFNIDSDEEVVANREKNGSIRPKDIYEV